VPLDLLVAETQRGISLEQIQLRRTVLTRLKKNVQSELIFCGEKKVELNAIQYSSMAVRVGCYIEQSM